VYLGQLDLQLALYIDVCVLLYVIPVCDNLINYFTTLFYSNHCTTCLLLLSDNTKLVIDQHKGRHYVTTAATDEAERVLMSDSGVAVLTGNNGDGKTCMAWELVCRMVEKHGMKAAKITTPSEWRELVNPNKKLTVFH
jgi:hypothetical protein